MDFEKINKLSYISKRMCVIEILCKKRTVESEYLFGLFNIYNEKNRGRWFWQKAQFTGALKDAYDDFNKHVDNIVIKMGKTDKAGFEKLIEDSVEVLEKLLVGLELNCGINREENYSSVKSNINKNIKVLIDRNLSPVRKDVIG